MAKTVLVLGASDNPARYAWQAVRLLRERQLPVVAVGRRPGKAHGVEILTGMPELKDVDTVTLYLSAAYQQEYYDYILSLQPRRIIFNPGTENEALQRMAQAKGIETLEACTLTMLTVGNF